MDLLLGNNYDLLIDNSDFSLTTNKSESLKQRLTIKLLTFKNEWFLNENLGVPYYQSILRKNRSKESIDIIFKNAILEEEDVLGITSFSSSFDNQYRTYSLNFVVRSANNNENIPIELDIGG